MNRDYLEKVCREMMVAEREGAELMLSARNVLSENKTDHRDVVTEYDRRIQELLVSRIQEKIPDAKFFCEENDKQEDLMAEHLFIIDPIDGTMNFVRHFNHSCISMAYASRGEVLAAAVYNPYVDEMFTAVKGGGCFLNGNAVCIEDVPLSETIVCYGTSPYSMELADKTFEILKKVYYGSLDVRRQGSAELDLCSVAAGRAGLYFEMAVSTWDYAAGALLVEEAGGICRKPDGTALVLDGKRTGIVAGGKQAIEDFLRIARDEA